MTPDKFLAEIEAYCQAATPGPYYRDEKFNYYFAHAVFSKNHFNLETKNIEEGDKVIADFIKHETIPEWRDNADFYINARTDLPKLVEYCRTLRRALQIYADKESWVQDSSGNPIFLRRSPGLTYETDIAKQALEEEIP